VQKSRKISGIFVFKDTQAGSETHKSLLFRENSALENRFSAFAGHLKGLEVGYMMRIN